MHGTVAFVISLAIFTLVNAGIFLALWNRINVSQRWNAWALDQKTVQVSALELTIMATNERIAVLERTLNPHGLVMNGVASALKALDEHRTSLHGILDRIREIDAVIAKLQPKKTTPTPGTGTGAWTDVRSMAEAGEQRLRREEENAKSLQKT